MPSNHDIQMASVFEFQQHLASEVSALRFFTEIMMANVIAQLVDDASRESFVAAIRKLAHETKPPDVKAKSEAEAVHISDQVVRVISAIERLLDKSVTRYRRGHGGSYS